MYVVDEKKCTFATKSLKVLYMQHGIPVKCFAMDNGGPRPMGNDAP